MTSHNILLLLCLHPPALPQGSLFPETDSEVTAAFIVALGILTMPLLHFLSYVLEIMLNEQDAKLLHDNACQQFHCGLTNKLRLHS